MSGFQAFSLANHLKDFDGTWSEVRHGEYKSDAKDKKQKSWAILDISSLKVNKNQTKLAKIYDDPQKFRNGPIRSYHVKVKSDDLFIFPIYDVILDGHLEKCFD